MNDTGKPLPPDELGHRLTEVFDLVGPLYRLTQRKVEQGESVEGLSVTVHYREAPDAEAAVLAWSDRVGRDTGLAVRAAKRSVELHPPLHKDIETGPHPMDRVRDTLDPAIVLTTEPGPGLHKEQLDQNLDPKGKKK